MKVGDKVKWMKSSASGRSMSFRQMEGTITQIGQVAAEVRMKNGRKTHVLRANLRLDSEPGQVTELFKALAEAHK